MAEMTLSAQRLLAGAHVPTDYMGSFISALAGRYVPGLDANENGTCEKAVVDHIESLIRMLRNASPMYVHKDSADTALQFSVKPFDVWLGSILCSYAGGTAIGGLSAGNNRFIWADLSNAPAVTIGVGASWPTTVPYERIAAINAPASGHWIDTHLTSHVSPQAIRPIAGQLHVFRRDFAYNSGATVPFITLPATSTVLFCRLQITTLFNGSSPTINIGDSGNNSRFMATATAVPGSTGFKKNDDLADTLAAQTTANVYIGGSGASTGAARGFLGVAI